MLGLYGIAAAPPGSYSAVPVALAGRDMAGDAYLETMESRLRPCLFVEMDFPTGISRVSSLVHQFSWDSNLDGSDEIFTGLGDLGSVTAVSETVELEATELILTLTGVQAANISRALNEHYQGRRATIWVGFMDTDFAALRGDPFVVFAGRMDTLIAVDFGRTATLELRVRSRLALWDQANVERWNNASQQNRFPGDLGFEFTSQAAEKKIVWGTT